MFDLLAAANPKDALSRANFAVQDKLGKFMSLGNRVINLRDRAKNPGQVQHASEILEGITATQARALSVLGEAKTIQESLTAAPSIGAAKSALGVAQDLLSINAEMDALTSKADNFEREIGGIRAPVPMEFPWVPIGISLTVLAIVFYLTRPRRRKA